MRYKIYHNLSLIYPMDHIIIYKGLLFSQPVKPKIYVKSSKAIGGAAFGKSLLIVGGATVPDQNIYLIALT